MKGRTQEPCYGFKAGNYITLTLIGGEALLILLAIAFTVLSYSTWQLVLCWFFGVIFLVIGLFWDSMSSVAYPANIRALEENFLRQLKTL